jgi:thiamine biosynthesis lipoprotein
MGSELVAVLVGGADEDRHHTIARLAELESVWSRFLPESDITRINRAEGAAVRVCPDTMTLLATMLEAWTVTRGGYDPSVLRSLVSLGYDASRHDPSQRTVLPPVGAHPGSLHDIALVPEFGFVIVPAGVALDPGGIGKGLAADLIVGELLARGVEGALVSIGGDLVAAGTPPDPGGWVVGIEAPDPTAPQLCAIALDGGAVATSSTISRRWSTPSGSRHHLIDPATGQPSSTDLSTVTVVAASGWLAEAHATAAALTGSAGVLGYLTHHALSGIAVRDDGAIIATDDLAALLDSGVAA